MTQNQCSVSFFVAGDPAPQGSKSRDRYGRMYESSKRLKAWREAVAWSALAARHGRTFAEPVKVTLRFVLRINADLDKLVRSVFDGIQHGGLLADDKWVTELDATKRMHRDGRGCSVLVEGGR